MLHDSGIGNDATRLPFPSLNEQADLAEKHGADILLFCPDPGHYVTSSSTSRRVKLYERDAIGGIAYSVGLGKWISGGNWSRRLCSIGCVRLRYVIPALMRKRTGWLSGIMWRGRFDRNTEHTIEKVLMVGKPVASYLSLVFMCLGGAVWHGARDSQRCNHYC